MELRARSKTCGNLGKTARFLGGWASLCTGYVREGRLGADRGALAAFRPIPVGDIARKALGLQRRS